MLVDYDIVRAKKDLSQKVLIGTKGAVVMVYVDPRLAYEVEFIDTSGETLDVLTVYADDVEKFSE